MIIEILTKPTPSVVPYSRFLCGALACWFAAAAIPPPSLAGTPLRLAFDGDAVVVGDLEPGGEIVYFSVSRFSSGFAPVTARRAERFIDEDGNGEIRVELGRPAPPKFLAVAVALESGRSGVLTPPGSPARESALAESVLVEGPGHRLDRLEEAKSFVVYFLTRPGSGAWALSTGDGTLADSTPASDGIVRTALSSMEPVGGSPPPPEEYETGDLLVRVAPEEMEYYVERIERQ